MGTRARTSVGALQRPPCIRHVPSPFLSLQNAIPCLPLPPTRGLPSPSLALAPFIFGPTLVLVVRTTALVLYVVLPAPIYAPSPSVGLITTSSPDVEPMLPCLALCFIALPRLVRHRGACSPLGRPPSLQQPSSSLLELLSVLGPRTSPL